MAFLFVVIFFLVLEYILSTITITILTGFWKRLWTANLFSQYFYFKSLCDFYIFVLFFSQHAHLNLCTEEFSPHTFTTEYCHRWDVPLFLFLSLWTEWTRYPGGLVLNTHDQLVVVFWETGAFEKFGLASRSGLLGVGPGGSICHWFWPELSATWSAEMWISHVASSLSSPLLPWQTCVRSRTMSPGKSPFSYVSSAWYFVPGTKI